MKEQHLRKNPTLLTRHYEEVFVEQRFRGVNGCLLRYIRQREITSPNGLLILGGRTEFVEKYQELFYDLSSLNCSIYSYDHRGQGMSTRLLANSQKGYVNHFPDYVSDLKNFIENVMAGHHQRIVVLGFSMGGAVTTLLARVNPGFIDAAILCCPMFTINTFPLSPSLVGWIAQKAVSWGWGERFATGGRGYNFKAKFKNNPYTSSTTRFALTQALVRENPRLALGSPTYSWLHEAMVHTKHVFRRTADITIPILLLQSGNDTLVQNSAHRKFCKMVPNCKLYTVDGSRHELLMERDELREQALGYITKFIRQQIA